VLLAISNTSIGAAFQLNCAREVRPLALCLSELNICRVGKQPYRLPNIYVNAITNVGLDEASPTYRTGGLKHKHWWGFAATLRL
jgi:hypothetical protein